MKMQKKITTALSAALVALASAFAGDAQAQSVEPVDVTVYNDHLHVHRVLVFDAEGDRHMLGYVGHEDTEHFDIPAEVEAKGPYTVALQQFLPLPGIGVPVDPYPMKVTQPMQLRFGEMVSIVNGSEPYLSIVEFTNTVNR